MLEPALELHRILWIDLEGLSVPQVLHLLDDLAAGSGAHGPASGGLQLGLAQAEQSVVDACRQSLRGSASGGWTHLSVDGSEPRLLDEALQDPRVQVSVLRVPMEPCHETSASPACRLLQAADVPWLSTALTRARQLGVAVLLSAHGGAELPLNQPRRRARRGSQPVPDAAPGPASVYGIVLWLEPAAGAPPVPAWWHEASAAAAAAAGGAGTFTALPEPEAAPPALPSEDSQALTEAEGAGDGALAQLELDMGAGPGMGRADGALAAILEDAELRAVEYLIRAGAATDRELAQALDLPLSHVLGRMAGVATRLACSGRLPLRIEHDARGGRLYTWHGLEAR
jgi:hypothetical protein